MRVGVGRLFKYPENIPDAANQLDKIVPGWANKVDMNLLDLGHPNQCILGQIHGSTSGRSYQEAMREYFGIKDCIEFYLDDIFGDNNNLVEWKTEILTRKGK